MKPKAAFSNIIVCIAISLLFATKSHAQDFKIVSAGIQYRQHCGCPNRNNPGSYRYCIELKASNPALIPTTVWINHAPHSLLNYKIDDSMTRKVDTKSGFVTYSIDISGMEEEAKTAYITYYNNHTSKRLTITGFTNLPMKPCR